MTAIIGHGFYQTLGNTQTGPQSFTVDCGGLTPKAAIFIVGAAGAIDSKTDHNSTSVGFTDGTNTRVVSNGTRDNISTTSSYHGVIPGYCIRLYSNTGSLDCWAQFTSFAADTVNIEWLNDPEDNYYVTIIAFAGDDVSAHVGSFLVDTGVDFESQITGVGFESDLVINASTHWAALNYGRIDNITINLGLIQNDRAGGITQAGYALAYQRNAATSRTQSYGTTTYGSSSTIPTNLLNNWAYDVEWTSFNSDGWGYTPRNYARTRALCHLSLQFGSGATTSHKTWVGVVDSPTSTGTKTQTGVGFLPQFCGVFTSGLTNLDGILRQNDEGAYYGISLNSELIQSCHAFSSSVPTATQFTQSMFSDKSIKLYDASNALDFEATLTGFTNDGWDWNFTTVDSSARKWLAFAIQADTLPPFQLVGSATGVATASGAISVSIADVAIPRFESEIGRVLRTEKKLTKVVEVNSMLSKVTSGATEVN